MVCSIEGREDTRCVLSDIIIKGLFKKLPVTHLTQVRITKESCLALRMHEGEISGVKHMDHQKTSTSTKMSLPQH